MENALATPSVASNLYIPGRGFVESAPMKGIVHYELSRGGRILVPRTRVLNGISNDAKNKFLDAFFNSGSRDATWAIGLVDGATFTAFDPGDTMSAHTGWQEFTSYTTSGSGTNRPLWGQGSAASQALTNTSPAVYDFSGIVGTATVHGIFVVSNITKNSTANILWSTAAFLAPLTVQSGDQLRVTYTVQL